MSNEFTIWLNKLHAIQNRKNTIEEIEFLKLVDSVEGNITPEIAAALFETFSDKPDFGTQERVNSVLASGDKALVMHQMVEAIPKLLKQAPSWANTLLTTAIENDFELLQTTLKSSSKEVINCIKTITRNPDFINFSPKASQLAF